MPFGPDQLAAEVPASVTMGQVTAPSPAEVTGRGVAAMASLVRDVMTGNVAAVRADADFREIVAVMRQQGTG